MDKPDLSLLTKDDLIQELRTRVDGLVVVYLEDRTSEQEASSLEYYGGRAQALGLLTGAKFRLEQDLL